MTPPSLRLTACLTSLLIAPAVGAEPTVAEALERAAGVSLAEVVEISEYDWRPGDGNLEVTVKLKTVEHSGDALDRIAIIKAHGGKRAPGPPPAPDPLFPVPFKLGQQYWFIWSSSHVWQNHRILLWWPARDAAAPLDDLRKAVADDRYAWRPQLEPGTGIAYGRRKDPQTGRWMLRGLRDGKVLWERALDGEVLDNGYLAWGVWEPGNTEMRTPTLGRETRILTVVTNQELPADNPLGLPAKAYKFTTYYDLKTGAVVGLKADGHTVGVVRSMHPETARPIWERRWDWMPTGGLAVGSTAEGWLRYIEQDFDPKTGEVIAKQHFRVDGSTPVKIQPK